jgi:hypothetical protein
LLHDRGLLYCVSIAKFEGKDKDGEILAHIGNPMAFPNGGHLLEQVENLMEDGIQVDNCHLDVQVFECHDLACAYALVTRGLASPFKPNFCPWCFCYKKHSTQVVVEIGVDDTDTMSSISNQWRMLKTITGEEFIIIQLLFIQ